MTFKKTPKGFGIWTCLLQNTRNGEEFIKQICNGYCGQCKISKIMSRTSIYPGMLDIESLRLRVGTFLLLGEEE